MRSTPKIWIAMLAVALSTRALSAASFTASLDNDAITLGEQVTLSLKFDGVSISAAPDLPDIDGLQIQYAGPSRSYSFINGRTSSSVTFNYVVQPQRAGNFTIPALKVNADGQTFVSDPVTLTVMKAQAPTATATSSGNEVAFMKLIVPKKNVYVGQTIIGELQLYLRDDVDNFGNFQFTAKSTDGFTVGKMVQGNTRRTQIGNHIYTVTPLNVALTATRTGALSVGPFTAGATIIVESGGQQDDPLFRQFGIHSPFGVQGERRQISLATAEEDIQCLPLPEQSKPKNFSGAVGDFTMNVTVGPTNLTAGDPITVRVQISGRGSLDSVTLPDQTDLKNFKIFPPTVKTKTSGQLGLDGEKTFEEIVAPENPDVHEWPAFSFSFFDPNDGRYHTLTHPAVSLTVKAAGAPPLPTIVANKNPGMDNQAPPDISPIRQSPGTLAMNPAPLISKPVFLGVQTLPALAFLAALVWRKRTDNLANNPRLRRKLFVQQLVQNGLGDLKKFAEQNQPDEFFALLFRLLQEQLGERLDCPASSITENVVEENSVLRGAPDATRVGLRELFQLCNQARYAPVRGTSELNSVAARFENVLGELRNLKT